MFVKNDFNYRLLIHASFNFIENNFPYIATLKRHWKIVCKLRHVPNRIPAMGSFIEQEYNQILPSVWVMFWASLKASL